MLHLAGAPELSLVTRDAWRRLAALCALSFGAIVAWSRAGVVLHEIAHALVWKLQGGTVRAVEVTLFGGGLVVTDGATREGASRLAFDVAGIVADGALGLALAAAVAIALARGRGGRAPARASLAHVLAWGAVLNLAGATHYAAVGSFYGTGDTGAYPWLWAPAFAMLLAAMPVGVWLWARTLVPLAALDGGDGRVRLGAAGLAAAGLPLAAYVAALAIEQAVAGPQTQFATLRAEEVAIARAVEERRAEKVEAWRRSHGDEPPPPEVFAVDEDDVPRPFPFVGLVAAVDAAAVAGSTLLPWTRRAPRPPGRRALVLPLVAAALAVFVCAVVV